MAIPLDSRFLYLSHTDEEVPQQWNGVSTARILIWDKQRIRLENVR